MRLSLSLSLTGGSPAFTPESLTLSAWYDPSDPSTLFQSSAGTGAVAHGDPVGYMADLSGNGNHLIQATAGARPLYQESGGEKFLLFDGTDDFLAVTVAVPLPFDRITALRQTWVANDYIYFGGSSAGVLRQNASSPELRLISGSTTNPLRTSGLADGANGVVTERHAANASRIAANNDAYAGPTDAGATGADRINIGGGAASAAFRFYGAVIGALSDAEIAQVRTYLGAKCGVSL